MYKIQRQKELMYTLLDFIVEPKTPNIANVLTTFGGKLFALQIDLFKEHTVKCVATISNCEPERAEYADDLSGIYLQTKDKIYNVFIKDLDLSTAKSIYSKNKKIPDGGRLFTNFNGRSICYCYVGGSIAEFGSYGKVNQNFLLYETLKIDY
jgi:hypothetical protein